MKVKENAQQGSEVTRIRNIPPEVLEAFDNLVPDDPSGQAKASLVLLKHVDKLIKNQSTFKFHEDVIYIITRLVSGLSSSRQRVREGFCSTLQALLQLQPSVASFTYETIKEKSTGKKNLKKDEVRDNFTGELLGYGALIRSGQVKNNEAMKDEIIKRLFWLKEKKQYYEIVVSHYLVHMMEKYSKFVFYQEIMPRLSKDLSAPVKELTPCLLWLQLIILRKFPESAQSHFKETLSPASYASVAKIIVKTSADIPNVHPCLSEYIASLADLTPKHSQSRLVEYWLEGLAPYLKQPTTSCLQLLFNALQLILLKLKTAEEVKKVCTPEAILQLRNVMSLHDKNLSASARGVGSALLQLATTNYEKDNSVQLAVAQVIIEKPGSARFDQLTGTKLLNQMKWHFTPATVKAVSEIVRKIIYNENGEFKSTDRTGAAVFLGRLVPLPRMSSPEYEDWRKEQLILLMSLALFKDYNRQTLLQEYREVFFRCLSHQMSHNITEYRPLLHYITQEADKVVKTSQDTQNPRLQPKFQVTWDKIMGRLAEIENEEKLSLIASNIFQVLYGQLLLHLLVNATEAKEILDELNNSYREARRVKTKVRDDFDEISWVDMVVETLLSLLPRENTLFRALVQGVLWFLCPVMTATALANIVDVLDPTKQDDLVNIENSEDEEEDENEDEDENNHDSTAAEESDDSDDDDEDMEVDEEESEAEDDEKLMELRKKMLSLTGDVETEIDMDSVPQEELDSMDEKLGALVGEFIQTKNRSYKKTGAERLEKDERYLLNFRAKVCDMLELYVKEAPNMALILSLVNPLIEVLLSLDNDRKKQGELILRIRHLLFMLGKAHKFSENGNVTLEYIVEEFNSFFSTALKMRDEFNPIIRGCYYLFIRCGLQLLGEGAHDPNNILIQSYLLHIRQIFTQNKFTIRTQTVTDICLSNCGGLWSVAELMVDFSFSSQMKCYWRTQALQILVKLYGNDALFLRTDKESILKLEKDISSKICEVLNPSVPMGFIKGQYLAEIFRLLSIIRKNSKKNLPCGISWDEVGRIIVSLRQRMSSKTFKICRGSLNNIISSLSLNKLIKAQKKENPQSFPIANASTNQKLSTKEKNQVEEKSGKSTSAKIVKGKKRKLKAEKMFVNGGDNAVGLQKKKKKLKALS
ncbi:hypothetical protein SK128_002697 [Halocaridina rubra]|uniref:Myb-binding protein 1A n=1 Tax=Halocaridina rubra TaxID=373956 RepID=A0AAN9FUH3_HALRR